MTAAQVAAFADRPVPALRDAVTSGWNLPNELKEPDFDAIRDGSSMEQIEMLRHVVRTLDAGRIRYFCSDGAIAVHLSHHVLKRFSGPLQYGRIGL